MIKKITFKLSLILVLTLGLMQVYAQQRQMSKTPLSFEYNADNRAFQEESGFIKCATVEYNEALRQQYPEKGTDAEFESWMTEKIQQLRAQRIADPNNTTVVYNIPVVIHVIHSGQALGVAPNITDAQVISQITVMNEDYRRMVGTRGFNVHVDGADVEIEFCLAQQDPNGNPTNGVDHVDLGQESWSTSDIDGIVKPQTIWDPTRYLNMWTVNFSDSTLLGYAQFPNNSGLSGLDANNGGEDTDGVVANYNAFGSIDHNDGTFIMNNTFFLGRTMTHEVGHWLGLRHTWGDNWANGNPDNQSCGVDDFCDDTPNSGRPQFGCPTGADTCPGGAADMIENYMDYTDDDCMNIFTQDQKDRMVIVMQNSPRRVELATSNVCDASAPYIKFNNGPGTINEGTDCGYQDYDITLNIASGPSADATVTFTIDGGSATQNVDYELLTSSVVFTQGATIDKTMTVRVYNDGFVEGDETITFGMSIATTGDALPITTSENQFVLTIVDDNYAPTTSSSSQVFFDDFSDGDASDWSVIDNNAETADDWFVAQESNWETPFGIYTDYFMVSYSWNDVDYSPDNFLSSPQIALPAGNDAELKYFMGAAGDPDWYFENYQVWVSTSIATVTDITSGTLLVDSQLPDELGHYYTHDITSFAGQNVYISFRHFNTTGQWLISVDEVEVNVEQATAIQIDNNSASPTEFTVEGTGSSYFYDTTTSNIMMGVTNTGGNDYACVSGFVSRDLTDAGAAAVMHQSALTENYVMAKSFTINPGSVNASGAVEVIFYFTEDEVAAWETATGASRNDLNVIKNNEPAATTIGAFGSDVTLTANFSTGMNGVYVFGKADATVGIDDLAFETFMVYPNPSEGVFNLSLQSNNDAKLQVQLFDMRGRLVQNDSFNQSDAIINTTLDYQSIEVGIYLLKVSKGDQIGVQQIIIK